MNRRSLLKLLPVAAIGGLCAKQPKMETATVIESSRGTRMLIHRESWGSERAMDRRIVAAEVDITLDDIGTRDQWQAALYGKGGQ